MKKSLTAIYLICIAFSAKAQATENFTDEIVLTDDPYIGVKVDLSEYQPMVSLSNITTKLTPSKYVVNVDNLITSLAQAKTANKEMFKNNKKIVEYVHPSTNLIIKKVIKTAVYKDNSPDEYTIYILEDDKGKNYAMPDFELKETSDIKLTSYENGLINQALKQEGYVRIAIYLQKPPLYKDKYAPFKEEELQPVFDYFLDKIKDYDKDKVLLSQRNFRISMSVGMDTLAYLISDFNELYIEDIEIVSIAKKQEDEEYYKTAKPRYKQKAWYAQ